MIELNTMALECLADFITSYLGESPKHEEIRNFIEPLLDNRDIIRSYDAGILTQDEVCTFIYAHLYTRFIMNHPNILRPMTYTYVDHQVEVFFREKLKRIFFDS